MNQVAAQEILNQLTQAKAEALFLPFLLDEHPDHQATNRLFAMIAENLGRQVMVYAYEIWSPLKPNRLVDITAVAEKKELAIRKHLSQTKHINYAPPILGLNRFRSLALGAGQGLYEAFSTMDAPGYGRLVTEILGPHK